MSAVKGVNKTLIDSGLLADRLAAGQHDGRLKVIVDTYEAAALASGSTISMGGKLPKGARIQEVILHTDNLGNNTTISVGDAESAARYISATDHGGGAETISRLDTIAGRNYVVDESDADNLDNQIILTTGAGEATGTIKVTIIYSRD